MDYQPKINEATPREQKSTLSWEQSSEAPFAPSGSHSTPRQRDAYTEAGVKILALIGVIALLAFAVWGTVQVTRMAPGAFTAAVANFSALFVGNDDERIRFVLESHTLTAGDEVTIRWNHESTRAGAYLFRYDCAEGVSLETRDENGRIEAIRCGNPYTVTTSESEDNTYAFQLTPYSTESRFIDVPIALTFVPTNEREATVQGTTLLTIINTSINANGITNGETDNESPQTSTPVTPNRGAQTNEYQVIGGGTGSPTGVSNPLGTPDLAVTVLAVGYVDRLGETFTPSASIDENQRAAIRFEVRNVGDKLSGEWTFEAELPVKGRSGAFTYEPRENQRSLNPGERIEYTLGFDEIKDNDGVANMRIIVDPNERVAETNRTNNTATASILVEDN